MLRSLVLIASAIALTPLSLSAEVGVEKCIQRAEHTSLSIVMVDLSDKIGDVDNFRKSMSVFESLLRPGERVVVGISTDKVGDIKLLMDFVNPEPSVWISKLKINALQRQFKECFKESINTIELFNQKFEFSAILETLGFSAKIFKADPVQTRRLFMYSDMMQNSPSISFYKQKALHSDSLMSATSKEDLLPDLSGVEVLIAGVGNHESDKKVRELEKFWRSLFEAAKAKVTYFGPVLISFS